MLVFSHDVDVGFWWGSDAGALGGCGESVESGRGP